MSLLLALTGGGAVAPTAPAVETGGSYGRQTGSSKRLALGPIGREVYANRVMQPEAGEAIKAALAQPTRDEIDETLSKLLITSGAIDQQLKAEQGYAVLAEQLLIEQQAMLEQARQEQARQQQEDFEIAAVIAMLL